MQVRAAHAPVVLAHGIGKSCDLRLAQRQCTDGLLWYIRCAAGDQHGCQHPAQRLSDGPDAIFASLTAECHSHALTLQQAGRNHQLPATVQLAQAQPAAWHAPRQRSHPRAPSPTSRVCARASKAHAARRFLLDVVWRCAQGGTLTSVFDVQLRVNELVALQHLAQTAPLVRRVARARGLAERQVVVIVRLLRVVVLRHARKGGAFGAAFAAACPPCDWKSQRPNFQMHSIAAAQCCIQKVRRPAYRAHFVDPKPHILADLVLRVMAQVFGDMYCREWRIIKLPGEDGKHHDVCIHQSRASCIEA